MYACLDLFVCVPTFNIGLADQSLSIHHTPTVQKKRSSETGTSILPTARSSSTTPNFQHKKNDVVRSLQPSVDHSLGLDWAFKW